MWLYGNLQTATTIVTIAVSVADVMVMRVVITDVMWMRVIADVTMTYDVMVMCDVITDVMLIVRMKDISDIQLSLLDTEIVPRCST